jgi:D-lactate dehydrogenase
MFELLKNVHCFSDLDDEALLTVQNVIQLATFEAGELICTEGEIGDRMFIIESGDVAVLKGV